MGTYMMLLPIGQQKLQQAAAHNCNKVIADAKDTQAWLDKELAATHPPIPPLDLVADEDF